eukprot:TRINITY_DN65317_c0_g1_i1.p1 TRINITY_DN65317_c0_g1~~TRINITY_DN65317_c0_g1_i1.p1  ORF type:complete len:118 (-),score=18.46 TRINITY_DN65317_c0_g1_i1:44-397(-)
MVSAEHAATINWLTSSLRSLLQKVASLEAQANSMPSSRNHVDAGISKNVSITIFDLLAPSPSHGWNVDAPEFVPLSSHAQVLIPMLNRMWHIFASPCLVMTYFMDPEVLVSVLRARM